MIIVATINSSFLYTDLTGSLIMKKRFIPGEDNNVMVVDANGETKFTHCDSKEECCHLCSGLNGAEKDDRMANNNDNTTRSRA